MGVQNQSNSVTVPKKISSNVSSANVGNRKQSSVQLAKPSSSRKPVQGTAKNPEVKSILIPRKTPSTSSSGNVSTKYNSTSPSSIQQVLQGNQVQVTLNRVNVQKYLDRVSGSQTSISKTSNQQISPKRGQQSVSPNRMGKTSPSSVLNTSGPRPNVSKSTVSNSVNKSISWNNSTNPQSVLKTIEIHSNPVQGSKLSPNSVTISPVNESLFKDLTPSPEVLNLTKNSSIYISKMKEEPKTGRSNSPSIGIPLPSGITISPTNACPSTFLAKPQKPPDRPADVKINVSITKQEAAISLAKEKRESVLNMNVKREGPLQNIPDCISVTSKVLSNEKPKYEHVRKRALQEYHQQQQSPDRVKQEEKRLKTDDSLLTDMEIKDDKLDDKNFSKIFDSVIAKTSETVRQSESNTSHIKVDRYSGDPVGGGVVSVKNTTQINQFKNNPSRFKEIRTGKEKTLYASNSETNDDADERNENMKEQRVQMEMDRVMQNLVELSREKNSEYEYDAQHLTGDGYPSNPVGLKQPSFQEAFQKLFK